MQTHSFYAESVEELAAGLAASPFTPTFAIVFASVHQDLDAIQAAFAGAGIPVFGGSSAGEILENGGDTTVLAEALVVMLLDLQPDYFRLNLFDGTGKTSHALGQEVGAWVKAAFEKPAVLLMTSGMATDGEAVIRGLTEQAGSIPMFGGLAGDDLRMQHTFVFDAHTRLEPGVIALVLDNQRVKVSGIASSGWQPIGAEKTITRSEGNVVYTVDGQPALEIYRQYLGLDSNVGGTTAMTAEYPLQLLRENGDMVMRASMVINPEDGSMVYAGSVPQGAKVRFTVSPGTDIIDLALREITAFKEAEAPSADALVLFSCKGRHLALGPMAEDEIKPIQALWQKPLIGFYTYGEIGKTASGRMDFHNNTCVLVALEEVE